ncbi:unnamed protein product [Amoebophrya sp. A120]|nr:unnamed protein product [Amoebophrya sp. A120]|eukprot:GSA120T00024698001.1
MLASLPLLSRQEVQHQCEVKGKKWIIVDNTVLDVAPLINDKDGAHKGGNVFAIGRDNTHLFHELHANLPIMKSAHRPDLPSITAHIFEKVQKHAVGKIGTGSSASTTSDVPLISPSHRFWQPSERRPPFLEKVKTSIGDTNVAAELVANAVAGLTDVQLRAFYAIVGLLTADAAAQPTHWNYKVTYYHRNLKDLNRFETPEFLCPSQNQYYEVPCGSNSCFGDQAFVILESMARCGKLEVDDLVKQHVLAFGPNTSNYGPLGNTNVQSAGDLPIRGPWRHGSLDKFLRNVTILGKKFPTCGSNDGSSDCFIRAVPVVALHAGREDMLEQVAAVVRITQNNALTVAYACAAARILEQIILFGSTGNQAVKHCADALLSTSAGQSRTSQRARASSGLDSEIGEQLVELEEQLSDMPYLDGVRAYSGGQYNAVTVS